MTATEIIDHLGLQLLPGEGGYYRETYRSDERITDLSRSASTTIYYLLTADTYSALHRLRGDEVYHFYLGDPVELFTLEPRVRNAPATVRRYVLGPGLAVGQRVQLLVPGGVWQGSRLLADGQWALLGTTVTPGFDFADCELATPDLLNSYADWADTLQHLLPGE